MSLTEPRVLLGEPDAATAELYLRALRPAFAVLAANTVQAVHELLRAYQITVLVLEPAMFATGDWDEVKAIGQECAARGIPLVICSTLDERRRGMELGAAAYLVKPTLPMQLLHMVRQLAGHGEL